MKTSCSPSTVRPSPCLPSSLPPSTSSDAPSTCTLRGYRKFHGGRQETMVHVKSKLGSEYRRFTLSIPLTGNAAKPNYEEFSRQILSLHGLETEEQQAEMAIEYADPKDGCMLPINNDETLGVAIEGRPMLLRVNVQKRGESIEHRIGYGVSKSVLRQVKKRPTISAPQDFRRVSAIVDVDVLPLTLRRVQLCKYKTNVPLGFYIRDGISYRNNLPERGFFISRLVDNGIAASTNLLHPNDEILEVNGIDVTNKTLDQVTDIMIANSFNLVLTVRPALPDPLFPQFPSTHSPAASKRYESGLRSYMDMPPYGTLSSRGSSGENSSPPLFPSQYGPLPPLPAPGLFHDVLSPLYGGLPSRPLYIPPPHYVYGAPPSFSRNTTVRLSDKLRNERRIPSTAEIGRLRRPFSLYAPNLS